MSSNGPAVRPSAHSTTDGTGSTEPAADDKDWTWVLERACSECGFEAGSFEPELVGPAIRDNVAIWTEILAEDESVVRRRPDATTWSALEYACHVRDVFRVFDERLDLMLTEDGPHYANWDQDETAVEERYDLQDPAAVSEDLAAAGATLAARFDLVSEEQWHRTGFRSDGAEFTVDSFARYFIHDPIHHVHDVLHS